MKKSYTVSIWQEGKWFVAQCLEVDIASQGKTVKEALNNIQEALELYFEDPCSTLKPEVQKFEIEVNAA